jgi:putative membrane protein
MIQLRETYFMSNYLRVLTTAVICAALSGVCSARAENLSGQDSKFMAEAAKGGMTEVHMAEMGVRQGTSEAVKSFSQRLVNDHKKGNDELSLLAMKKGVALPADDPKSAMSMPLAKATGAAFDKAFAKQMVEDHEKTIALFEKEAGSGNDADVKNWASKTLPTLRAHLMEAQSLSK